MLFSEGLTIYVIHYTRFTERRAHMEALLRNSGLDQFPIRWVTEHDREELLNSHAEGKWCDPGKLAAGSVSLILKHLLAYQLITVKPQGWHLILEDDILIQPESLKKMYAMVQKLPSNWELFFIGLGCQLHVPWWKRRPGKEVYFRGWKKWWRGGGGCSRCTEAYFINPTFANRLLASRFAHPPFDTAIDWLLNKAGWEMRIHSYWAEPPVITQGAFVSWTKDPSVNELLT